MNVRHLPPFFEYRTELSYSKTERVKTVNEIEHPAIRNAMKMLHIRDIRLTYEADLPARSGLGTSSSFAVGMLSAFHAMKGEYLGKKKLADEAIYLERVLCQEAGGWQDQIAASFGGFNRINFNADGYEVLPVVLSPDRKRRLNQNLLIFFTGFTRFSSDVQKANASDGKDKTGQLREMLALVDEAERILTDQNADLDEFGRLLDHTWKLKRQTGAAVSTDRIDELYAKGMAAGALGGKLLGAGGGGFLCFMCSQIVKMQFGGRCVIYYKYLLSLKTMGQELFTIQWIQVGSRNGKKGRYFDVGLQYQRIFSICCKVM